MRSGIIKNPKKLGQGKVIRKFLTPWIKDKSEEVFNKFSRVNFLKGQFEIQTALYYYSLCNENVTTPQILKSISSLTSMGRKSGFSGNSLSLFF